jgi:molybdenum cofactor guanylyltransferase
MPTQKHANNARTKINYSMLGIILSGGQSSRMGQDKGLLKLEAKTWAQTAIDKLSILNIPVKISVNRSQFSQYAEVFSPADLIEDNETLSLKGPLLGVLSAHVHYPDQDLFILACDMPLMESSVLQELDDRFRTNKGAEVYIFTNEGEPEPLCGIYTSKAFATVTSQLHSGQLNRYSMKNMLEQVSVHSIPLTEEQKKYFRNFNAHAELNGL